MQVGNLVDFDSHAHGGWFVGEVTRIVKSWGLRTDDVSVHISQFGDSETVPRDRGRLWPSGTKSAPVRVAAAAAAAFPASNSAAAFAPVRSDGQAPDRAPYAVADFGYQLREGDECDCWDTERKWRISEVIGSTVTHLLIHYSQCGRSAIGVSPAAWLPDCSLSACHLTSVVAAARVSAACLCSAVGWSSFWAEWISKGDPRIQPPRSHPLATPTRPARDQRWGRCACRRRYLQAAQAYNSAPAPHATGRCRAVTYACM